MESVTLTFGMKKMNESRQYRAAWLVALNVPALYYLAYVSFFATHYNTSFQQGDMLSLWPTLLASPIAAIVMVAAIVYILRHSMPRSLRISGLVVNAIALVPCGMAVALITWWIGSGGLVH